ncbi:response regulator [Pontiella sp.]|uniref:response regulator n=1 Tax=Pontiella sp. TaxID=2837462 RepID=UPI003569BB6A
MNRILLIDDDPTLRKLFSQFLSKNGYEVSQAENGKIGLDQIELEKPDLIITDILMPEMDGLEILLALRKKSTVPIIAISGGMRGLPVDFLKQAKLFGARYVFEKPVPLGALLSAVKDLLKAK